MRMIRVGIPMMLIGAFFAGPLNAQTTEFGFKGGMNLANLGGSDAPNTDSRIGIAAGGFFSFNVHPMFAVQPELLYSMKGAKFTDPDFTGTFKLEYLEFPVVGRLLIPVDPASTLRPSLYAGPALGIELGCDIKAEEGNVTVELPCDEIGFDTRSTDLGLVVGGEVAFDRGGMRVGVEARYNLGLRSIDDDPDPADIKNRVFSIMATIAFGG